MKLVPMENVWNVTNVRPPLLPFLATIVTSYANPKIGSDPRL